MHLQQNAVGQLFCDDLLHELWGHLHNILQYHGGHDSNEQQARVGRQTNHTTDGPTDTEASTTLALPETITTQTENQTQTAENAMATQNKKTTLVGLHHGRRSSKTSKTRNTDELQNTKSQEVWSPGRSRNSTTK